MGGRSKSSKFWLKSHFSDHYVKRAQNEGYRSRAAYKLLEINEKDKLIKPGMVIVDLGAAPGGWSQVAAELTGEKGKIIAIDLLPMKPLPGVHFIQGDFSNPAIFNKALKIIGSLEVDLVISDLAPNLSGNDSVDQPKVIQLAELALNFTREILKPGGAFLVKMFQGVDFEQLLQEVRSSFNSVVIRKPKASRAHSREAYFVSKGYNH